jgi:polysaccharide export outer membrane protein
MVLAKGARLVSRVSSEKKKLSGVVVKRSLGLAASVAVMSMGVGCEVKSFIDPSEVGRYERQPLKVSILNTLDTGVEEPNTQFLNATDPTPEDLIATRIDYKIDRGDLVNVSVSDLQAPGVDTVRSVRVSESGRISLPYIGQISALGRSEGELESDVIDAYRKGDFIQNAQVSVSVAEARGRAFSISGAVNQTGQFAIIQSDFRVLDAMVLARDVQTPTIEYMYVIRKKSVDAQTQSPTVPQVAPPPATGPSPDALEPKVEAEGVTHRPVYLQTTSETPAVANAPATTAPVTGAEDGGERYIVIDGKPVRIPGNAAAPEPTAPTTTDATVPAPAAPGDAADAMAPAPAPAPFEFVEPDPLADARVIRIPFQELMNGELKYNIVVKPQDMIIVPQPTVGEYYMGGHVNRVGVYSLTGRKITLTQAVVSAGMLDQLAIPERTEIRRRVGKDQEVIARVDLAKVFEGSQPNLYLKPDDVVTVGTNFLAPFLAAIRGGFRVTYGFGFLYDRNYADDRQQFN